MYNIVKPQKSGIVIDFEKKVYKEKPRQEEKMQTALIFLWIYVVPKVSCEGCLESIPTITVVNRCPKDITEWIKSKSRKQCHLANQNCTTLERFEYHCLPDKYHESFMEVCAPRKNIVGGHCPFYDEEKNSVAMNLYQSCKEHTTPCPDLYNSNVAYRYQECYTGALKRTKDDNNERTLSKMVSVSTFVLQILISIIQFLILIAVVYFIKKHKRRSNDCIAMEDLRSQHHTKSTTSSRPNSDVSIGSQINTIPSRSLSENNYISNSNSSLVSNHL